MADKSTYLAGEILKLLTGQTMALSLPIVPWLALFTVAPTKTTLGTEVSGGGYGRLNVSGKFAAPVAGVTADSFAATVSNNALCDFGTASAAWGNVIAAAIFPTSTSNQPLVFGNLATTKNVNASDPVNFPVGQLILQEV